MLYSFLFPQFIVERCKYVQTLIECSPFPHKYHLNHYEFVISLVCVPCFLSSLPHCIVLRRVCLLLQLSGVFCRCLIGLFGLVLLTFSISLLTFYLIALSITGNRVLKSLLLLYYLPLLSVLLRVFWISCVRCMYFICLDGLALFSL